MNEPRERILLVESDPDIYNLVAKQALQPSGYKVKVARTAAQAIQDSLRFSPDLVIADLNLPGLSGKDLIIALSSQGLQAPVIVIASKGSESDVIQSFRLGASDYLMWPARETEVVAAVERTLEQVRARREREGLSRQLKGANEELQRRVRELTTIFAIGKAVTSITDQGSLFEKIVEGAVYVTEADSGWLLLRDNNGKSFRLTAQRNLPPSVAHYLHQPWDDGLSSLVALSGETLSIHGKPMERFKIAQLGRAALVAPVKIKKEVFGLLTVLRKAPQPFSPSNKTLLEGVADYASISLVNVRLFQALEQRVQNLQQNLQQTAEQALSMARAKDEVLQNLRSELSPPLSDAIESLHTLLTKEDNRLNATQKSVLRSTEEKLRQISHTVETLDTKRQNT